MFNDRPIEDEKLEQALELVQMIAAEYDLTACVMLQTEKESAWFYKLDAKWSAITKDAKMPLGFRITAKSNLMGKRHAHRILTAAASTIYGFRDFGAMTYKWMSDLAILLKQRGIEVEHTPFEGMELGDIEAIEREEWDSHPQNPDNR